MSNFEIEVYKDPHINQTDIIEQGEFDLNSANNIKDGVVLLYVYYLSKLPLHGYKVGMTKCKLGEPFWKAIRDRISNQEKELLLNEADYQMYGCERVVRYWGICLKDNDVDFKDHDIHRRIMEEIPGIAEKENEWFSGTSLSVDMIIDIFKDYRSSKDNPYEIYTPRKEQRAAIDAMKEYYSTNPVDNRFLLNCKMRFGKCYTVYKYAEETNKRKILILTFVPAVQDEWYSNLKHIKTHYDYFTDADLKKPNFKLENNPEKPYVVFLSLQNYLGKDSETKETKSKILKLQDVDFDILVLDEYHFGAWNDRTGDTIIEDIDPKYLSVLNKQKRQTDVVDKFGIMVDQILCLSGTPFKALDRGDFSDSNSYSYSYFDEQKNKYYTTGKDWKKIVDPDYEQFPDMKIYGYNMASLFGSNTPFVREMMKDDKEMKTDHKLFSLNKFFETENDIDPKKPCTFIHKEEIVKWLATLCGAKNENNFKFPYAWDAISDVKDSLWLMPSVNACIAMESLLKEDTYFKNFQIINLSSPDVGAGMSALNYLRTGLTQADQTGKLGTISLTVNKLTLGITVKEWRAVFVLKDLSSPEQYFQSIFRIQTPLVVNDKILKKECSVYDFNIDRASLLLIKYAERSNQANSTRLDIADLIVKYMPIYLNGDVDNPIEREVLYQLARMGDTSGQPLSKLVTDTGVTVRLDHQKMVDMMSDEEVAPIVNKVFAHARFTPSKKRTIPNGEKISFHKTVEYKKGLDFGNDEGHEHYKEYVDLDNCQEMMDEAIEGLYKNSVPPDYNEEQCKWYHDGVADGFVNGINVPIKKMQCGADDGKKFIDEIKKQFGENVIYNELTKSNIDSFINSYLNDINHIPIEYRGVIYKKWYSISFRNAARNGLKDPKEFANDKSVEDIENTLKHILARLFQFLYISLYRETTFKEIFDNADPDVFLSAVGITKDEFVKLNKYELFEENALNRYIHEFFVNETLGKTLSDEDKNNKYYRNSFNWFGYGLEN